MGRRDEEEEENCLISLHIIYSISWEWGVTTSVDLGVIFPVMLSNRSREATVLTRGRATVQCARRAYAWVFYYILHTDKYTCCGSIKESHRTTNTIRRVVWPIILEQQQIHSTPLTTLAVVLDPHSLRTSAIAGRLCFAAAVDSISFLWRGRSAVVAHLSGSWSATGSNPGS